MSTKKQKKSLFKSGAAKPNSSIPSTSNPSKNSSGSVFTKSTKTKLENTRKAELKGGSSSTGPALGKKSRILLVLSAIGPGMISAMAGNDAGGIATYSTCGALFGYRTLWIIPVMMIFLIIVQEAASRMGAKTGKGLSSLIRERFGIRLAALAMLTLLTANTATTFSEFAGIAAAMELFGVSKYISVPIAALTVWLLIIGGSYKKVQNIFLVISCVFITYIAAGILAGPDWVSAFSSTFAPQPLLESSYLSLIIATIGTTIAPWMIFFTQSNVVEKGSEIKELPLIRIDAVTGAIAACVVAWFIILTTGTVLYPEGIVISDAADAATALGPIAGEYATVLFGAGLLAASLLAACVLPLTTSEVICEAFGWERGVDHKWKEAPLFNGIFTAIVIFSALIVLIPNINLMGMMLVAQQISGVLLPLILIFMLILLKDRRLMGKQANGKVLNFLFKFAIVVMISLSLVTYSMQLFGFS